MNKLTGATLAVTATLILSACASPVGQTEGKASGTPPTLPPSTSSSASSPTPPPTPVGPPKSARGNYIKALGEEGGLEDTATHTPIITFAVDSIAPIKCTQSYSSPPENGTLIAVQMRVSTSPALATSQVTYFSVNPNEFSFIGADGITVTNVATAATYSCIPSKEELTHDQMSPGSQYVGKIILDVPAATGTLVYRPASLAVGGWEWSF
jgi:hypothetical protein